MVKLLERMLPIATCSNMQVRASPIRAAAAAASADVDVDVVVASVPGVAGAGGAGGAGDAGAGAGADAIAIHRERFFRVMGAAWCVADDNSAVFSAFIGFGKGSAAGVLHRDLDRSVEDGMIV